MQRSFQLHADDILAQVMHGWRHKILILHLIFDKIELEYVIQVF